MNLHVFMAAIFATIIAGCFPYASDFTCENEDKGQCVSIKEAYNGSLDDSQRKKRSDMSLQDELDDISKSRELKKANLKKENVVNYHDALYNKLRGLLSEPETPVVAPPQVMRVLLFPYRGDGNRLYMPRFVYMFVDEPKWILDEKSSVQGVE